MKKSKKILSIVLSIALVAGISVGATLAILSERTVDVTNTFTITKGLIPDYPTDPTSFAVVESNVKQAGNNWVKGDGTTTTGVKYTTIYPNSTIFKDPLIQANGLTEASYIYVYINDGSSGKIPSLSSTANIADGWSTITVDGKTVYYAEASDAASAGDFSKALYKNNTHDVVSFTPTGAATTFTVSYQLYAAQREDMSKSASEVWNSAGFTLAAKTE